MLKRQKNQGIVLNLRKKEKTWEYHYINNKKQYNFTNVTAL